MTVRQRKRQVRRAAAGPDASRAVIASLRYMREAAEGMLLMQKIHAAALREWLQRVASAGLLDQAAADRWAGGAVVWKTTAVGCSDALSLPAIAYIDPVKAKKAHELADRAGIVQTPAPQLQPCESPCDSRAIRTPTNVAQRGD